MKKPTTHIQIEIEGYGSYDFERSEAGTLWGQLGNKLRGIEATENVAFFVYRGEEREQELIIPTVEAKRVWGVLGSHLENITEDHKMKKPTKKP